MTACSVPDPFARPDAVSSSRLPYLPFCAKYVASADFSFSRSALHESADGPPLLHAPTPSIATNATARLRRMSVVFITVSGRGHSRDDPLGNRQFRVGGPTSAGQSVSGGVRGVGVAPVNPRVRGWAFAQYQSYRFACGGGSLGDGHFLVH